MMTELKKSGAGIYEIPGIAPLYIGIAARSSCKVDYCGDAESIRSSEKDFLGSITGIERKNIIMLNQVHGDKIVQIEKAPSEDSMFYADADGMITDLPGICFVIRTADCVPVVACDRERKILGAVHSGWRGCRLEISRRLVADMKRLYNSEYRDITIYILPSICPESYIVDRDVACFFKRDTEVKDGSIYLNLWQNIEMSLMEEGIPEDNIFNSNICTLKNNSEFFSHRGSDAGRNLNFCLIREF